MHRESLVGSYAQDADWLVLEAPEGPMSVHPVTASLKSLQTIRGVLAKATRPDGSDVWLQIDAVPQLEPSGEVTRVVASMADVSHLFARSRLTSRSAGDHIVSEVLAELADAGLETRAILKAVTNSLSKLRPGTWVAALLNKDPSTSILEVADATTPEMVEYFELGMAAIERPGELPTTGLTQQVIESGKPLLLPQVSMEELMRMSSPTVAAYVASHPFPVELHSIGLLMVPMRARGAIVGVLSLGEHRSSNPLTEKDVVWMQAIADRTALAVENAQLYEDAVMRLERLGALEVYHRTPLTPDQEWVAFLDALGSVAAIAIDNAAMQDRLRKAQFAELPRRAPAPPLALSRLEIQILRLIVEGLTNREIAAQVHLSQNTIKFHVRQMLQKTGTTNRTDLAHRAAKESWL